MSRMGTRGQSKRVLSEELCGKCPRADAVEIKEQRRGRNRINSPHLSSCSGREPSNGLYGQAHFASLLALQQTEALSTDLDARFTSIDSIVEAARAIVMDIARLVPCSNLNLVRHRDFTANSNTVISST